MNMTTPVDLDGQPLELLIKLMKMTGAEDNIALVAIRKANSHLHKLNTDWEAVLRGKVKIIADPFANINIPASAMNPNRNQEYSPPPPAPPPPAPKPRPAPKPQAPSPPRPTAREAAFQTAMNQAARRAAQNLPDPGPGNGTEEKRIVNKHDGTCIKCKNRVLAGHGFAVLWKRSDGKTKWLSEHNGPCPTTQRFHKPVVTNDDFQV